MNLSSEFIIRLAGEAVYTTLKASAPMMVLALAVGLLVSIFQATTQIQEQTLAFVPKIVAVLVGLVFFGPWMLSKMVSYAHDILNNLTQFIG